MRRDAARRRLPAGRQRRGRHGIERFGFRRGCLIGNLGQELGGTHDGFRDLLEQVFRDWQGRVARCLETAREAGELTSGADCARLAEFFWIGREGAILRGVTLAGIDSVYRPKPDRIEAWELLATDLDLAHIEAIMSEIPLSAALDAAAEQIAGKVRGRVVVDVNR